MIDGAGNIEKSVTILTHTHARTYTYDRINNEICAPPIIDNHDAEQPYMRAYMLIKYHLPLFPTANTDSQNDDNNKHSMDS